MKSIISLSLFCSLVLVFTVSAADVPFEATDSDGNTVSGIVVLFDAERLVLDSEGTKTEIPTEKLVKLQSLFENPFFPTNSATEETPAGSPLSPLRRNQNGRTVILNGQRIVVQNGGQILVPNGRIIIEESNSSQNKSGNETRSKKNTSDEKSGETKFTFPDIVSVLELRDGSRLIVTDFAAKGQSATCKLLNNEEITLPLNQLLTARLVVKGLAEVAASPDNWQKLVTKTEKGDRIVVGQPGSLDVYVGILAEVGKETISFIVDGETLPVPRRKVFGLLFHTPENANANVKSPELLPLLGSLHFWNGTSVLLHSLKWNENNRWTWTTVSGISGTILSEEIDEFDLGRKNAFYLTDLKPALFEQVFFFDQEAPAQAEALTMLRTFRTNKVIAKEVKQATILPPQPRTDARQKNIPDHPIPGLEGFLLEGVSYEHGLTIPAKTILEYTLTEPFAAFRTVAGIDDRLRPEGAVRLRVEADGQQLGDWEFHGNESAIPLKIDLPPGTKALRLEIDFVKGFATPNILTLADPKLIRL